MIFDFTPYSVEQRLFGAYADCMALLNDDDYAVFRDGDTIYTTPNFGELIFYHTQTSPVKCFTGLTNRIGCDFQKDQTAPEGNNYLLHRQHGIQRQKNYFQNRIDVTERGTMSGFWMCIRKDLWDRITPPTTIRILDVDTHIHRQIRALGEKIYLLPGLYLYHYYSNYDGIGERDKSHLK